MKPVKHNERMKNLFDNAVKLSKSNTDHHAKSVNTLLSGILENSEHNIEIAASNGQTKAFIFVYAIGGKYNNIPIYEYLFPNDEFKKKLNETNLTSVFEQIVKYYDPFKVQHLTYKVDSDYVPITINEGNYRLFKDGYLDDKSKYIGVISVSWDE